MKFWLLIFLVQICSPSFALTDYDKAEATLGKQYQARKSYERKIDTQVYEPYETFKKSWLLSSTHTYSETRAAIGTLRQIETAGEAIKKQISVELSTAGQKQIENIDGTLEHLRNVLSVFQNTVKNEPSAADGTVFVDIELVCGLSHCPTNKLVVSGPGSVSYSHNTAIVGGNISGTYSYSASFGNGYGSCSGSFRLSGSKKNFKIKVYKDCRDAGSFEF